MDVALRPRYSITCTCSLASSLPRCLDHQEPARRLPPSMITALDPECCHDRGANRMMLGERRGVVGAHALHFIFELAPLAAVEMMSQLVKIATALAHLREQ